MRNLAPTFIDLFSGCGGFSLGLKKAGFIELAAIDFDPKAIAVFRANFPDVPWVLEEDLKSYEPRTLAGLLETRHVDLIVGGPPCQGFSMVRQVDGANSGARLVEDDRRVLFREFLKFVGFFEPRAFVMENVPGIRSAAGGLFFTQIQTEARKLGYRVHSETVRAWEFGVPQKRIRQLIVGTRLELPLFSGYLYMQATHGREPSQCRTVSLWEAIGDLPPLQAGSGRSVADYDLNRRARHAEAFGNRYIRDVLEVHKANRLTGHRARQHSERDLRDFRRLSEGENSSHAIKRGKRMEFPYDRDTFKDRYTRQSRAGLCSTIVAHLSKDGLMFIHPTQDRSITPREAARIQSFPDWFDFPVAQTHQFRLIGNAVPPLVGAAVGDGLRKWLTNSRTVPRNPELPMPKDQGQAITWLLDLLHLWPLNDAAAIPRQQLTQGWAAIGYLFFYLHPDGAKENGVHLVRKPNISIEALEKLSPGLQHPQYARSGWPVRLVPIAKEARRRFDAGEMSAKEYYCSAAFVAGLEAGEQGGHEHQGA